MTKTKVEISRIIGEVKAQGNGARVNVPKSWIGRMVEVLPLESIEEDNNGKENHNDKTRSQEQPSSSQTKTIEDKLISKVAKEVGENYITKPTRHRTSREKR